MAQMTQMAKWTSLVGLAVAMGATAAAGVALGGQTRVPDPQKVQVVNRAAEAVPVALQSDAQVALAPETIARLKEQIEVRLARVEWEYRELRVATSPANYNSVVNQLTAAGADGWETTGLSFSDSGATVVILKRQK